MEMDFSILGTVFVCVFLIERNNTATATEVASIQWEFLFSFSESFFSKQAQAEAAPSTPPIL